ncbi:MAG: alpha-glucan family phosphorylase [Melioribacteraceae bacterium]|nr:alpha-glucan family phosphorylase [Melioribacteraceae bacterium]MCF8356078.1 alpha-glucan family phosphorylase [Melioribacteraceae bacterium]MCF8395533.1 alpha-glucan family phosphorylase [Melioribacteraceae bacterium]MCF8420605.1 alpha-glucan family phosphorylase [Melioribacteraceae bacterium]
MINFIGTFNVFPRLPQNLEPLREISYNLYWTWNQDAVELFRRLDMELWEETHHNPVLMLGRMNQERLQEVSSDDGFISHMNRVYVQLTVYSQEITWYQKNYKADDKPYISYFSAEFGLTECLQIYSGGLGILSGDHLKSASDLGIPLVAVGLCYKEGYFQQYLNADGWQQERYEINDFYNQPMTLVTKEDGEVLKISLDFPGRKVSFQIWKIQVGRIPLYLLDTNLPENREDDKRITRTLYGGNNETRIQQEIILGIGGIRALHAMDVKPLVCHMNEGHSAFLSLERIRYLIQNYDLSFQEAKDVGSFSNIFTTHTPVPAGIDVFPNDLVEKYFGNYYRNELRMSDKQFYKLGTIIQDKEPSNFNMAHLAMNMASFVNGVSKLHGQVSKKMWVDGFKNIPFDEIPIDYVTNGIHTHSHLSNEMSELLYRYLGDKIIQNPSDPDVWKRIDEIPDEELWRTHERRRERLVAFARSRLRKQIMDRGGSETELAHAKEVLNASALTIGFARRFATYKRATLLFKDIERLASIICTADQPVQFIIAGKAHPRDDEGKKLIQDIASLAKTDSLRKRIVFIENYDMNVARYMVEGCDIWLNNPRRPLEASGTSGMKIIANGGLNFSVLDGWWDEGYDSEVGWKIGSGEEYDDLDYQDEVEARLIYETLEKEIVPVFYEKGEDKLPRGWIAKMKASMKKLGPVYNTDRMVEEYARKFYFKSYERRKFLMENDWEKAKEFSAWKKMVIDNWNKVKFINIQKEHNNGELQVGASYLINAEVELGDLTPDDVDVQIYYGKVDDKNKPDANKFVNMKYFPQKDRSKIYQYQGEIDCDTTGNFGYTLRILPKNSLLVNSFELGLIRWA